MNSIVPILLVLICLKLNHAEILEIDSLKVDLNKWWGPGEAKDVDTSVREFKIEFKDDMIEDLRCRIRNRRKPYPPRVEGRHFEDGFNTDQLDSWMDFWAEEYAFKEQEDFLNKEPQYLINIGGIDIHFIWKKAKNPSGKRVIPLLMLHGFPGSVREFYEIMPLLTAENSTSNFVVDLVIPAIPGFGFSEPAVKQGMDAAETAIVFRNVMKALGYNKYFVHGGDWGAIIGGHLATMFHKEVMGYHINFVLVRTTETFITWAVGSLDPDSVVDPSVQDRMYPLTDILGRTLRNFGYYIFQATKPDTISVGVSDSPTGLLTYILSFFSWATRKMNEYEVDGGLSKYYTKTQLIDNLMYYWTTNSVATAMRFYLENERSGNLAPQINGIPTPVPTWTVQAPDELFYFSPALLKYKMPNLVNATVLWEGGHFLALEKPQVLADDILKSISEYLALENYSCNAGFSKF